MSDVTGWADVIAEPAAVTRRVEAACDTVGETGGGGAVDATEQLRAIQRGIWSDPVGWLWSQFRVELWSKQRAVIEALRDNPLVAVHSCNAAGKSFLAACVAHWYMESVSPSQVILTGASWTGIEQIVWPWIRKLHTRAVEPLGGTLKESVRWDKGVLGGLVGIAATDAERFSGFRTEHGCLVIVDEASSLTGEIHNAIKGLTASEGSRVLYIGNPLYNTGKFAQVCHPGSGWHVIGISAFDTPNVRAGRNCVPGLATRDWVESCKQEWGEESAEYSARVLGQFPATGQNSFFNGTVLARVESEDVRPEVWRGDVVVERDTETQRIVSLRLVRNDESGKLKLWREPPAPAVGQPIQGMGDTTNYVIGADVSSGTGASNSVASIADSMTREKVGEYAAHDESPDEFASTLDALGQLFAGKIGRAFLIWEANGDGTIMGKRLTQLGYSYFYWHQDERSHNPKRSRHPGWWSSLTGKVLLCGQYRGALARREFIQRSRASVLEARSYIRYPSGAIGPSALVEEAEGARAAHGDRVIADALACRGLGEQPKVTPPPKRIPPSSYEGLKARRAQAEAKRDPWG